jgi:hypothetical protein
VSGIRSSKLLAPFTSSLVFAVPRVKLVVGKNKSLGLYSLSFDFLCFFGCVQLVVRKNISLGLYFLAVAFSCILLRRCSCVKLVVGKNKSLGLYFLVFAFSCMFVSALWLCKACCKKK